MSILSVAPPDSPPRARRHDHALGGRVPRNDGAPVHAQLYAHRTLVPVPLDGTERAIGFLPAIDYFAHMQRGSAPWARTARGAFASQASG